MIRVVSWNIEHGKNIEQAASEIASIAELKNPDILLVQEMADTNTLELAERLGLDYRYDAPADHPETGLPFGNAILSPWPLGETGVCPLPHVARIQGQPRSVTSTVVTVDGVAITAFSVHIETVLLGLGRRVKQVDTLASAIVKAETELVVVGGDFNTASRRSTRRFDAALGTAGLDRATGLGEPTFHRFGRPFTLDHLYAKGLVTATSGVAAAAMASDHKPIWATITPVSTSP